MPPALRHRAFAIFWVAAATSAVGTWMQNVARAWVIYRQTDDPLWLGWLGASVAIPMIVLPVIGGSLVDRFDRARVLVVTQLLGIAVAVALAALSFAGALRPWQLLVASAVSAVALAADNPARQALVSELVPAADLDSAVALSAASFQVAAMIGPALAGLVLHALGPAWCFLLNAMSFVGLLLVLPTLPRPASPRRGRASLADALALPRVRALLLVAAIVAIGARSYPQLLPLVARALDGEARTYGFLLSASGVGAVGAAIVLSTRAAIDDRTRDRAIRRALLALAISLGALAAAPSRIVALLSLVAAGASATATTTGIAAALQHAAAPAVRGRVLGLYATTLIGLPWLGSLFGAALSRALSVRTALLLAAATALAARWSRRGVTHAA
ncbi:MAG: MFS transporter [Deltaproteobacteria bacterium]|nr:MFS transporter [Deltaproteobacteria bacterium]